MTQPADHREHLTYATATPEQVAEAREAARRTLAEADEHWTAERRRRAFADHDRRLRTPAA